MQREMSFSLVRFFWTSKRNEQKATSKRNEQKRQAKEMNKKRQAKVASLRSQ
jgi:hypothetical protein